MERTAPAGRQAFSLLTPVPRELAGTGEWLPITGLRLGCARDCADARRVLPTSDTGDRPLHVTVTADGDVPAEGYTLAVEPGPDGPRATVRGADPAGAFYGVHTLRALLEERAGHVPRVRVRDWPALTWRGTVEGFYGPP
ncbi:glycoside hydrolase family 20 zincin-like fold domain-containing protein [Georgenia sp. H159]|uniref:glycoside hydrolase family 20 zincin-like fold domain-containing protein n=1 Tax=Georgenia sp. H159 TaxID=3076115 RepID=UPI002D7A3105|nr:glycoside hydrolase family 20 zincin-like fold domain-containing protein [Georgenia sp. H159]